MSFRNKRRLRIIKSYSIGWTLALIFLSIVRGIGTVEVGHINFDFLTSVIFCFIIGPFFGAISGFAQIIYEERVYKRISIKKLVLFRLIYFILFLTGLVLFAYFANWVLFGIEIGIYEFAFDDGSFPVYFYIATIEFFLIIISQVNQMLGDRKLGQLLQGKFYIPREEERIFMFLDLQSSTQLAEKLGHIKYSMLIQDCFSDLGVVIEDEAEIYQYVGDEAVLTWKLSEGIKNHNCLNAYFNFRKQLHKKNEYYQEVYSCSPFFKAGLHAGIVTVTEVGKYKKEIAYHGDTLNTAARIQGKCNEFGKEILISEYIKNKLNDNEFGFEKLGSVSLRGKNEEVFIYAVQ
ncbi:MAG: adenylate/guanylate cyclase domain-containing protein [Calditrichaeota bacterium]|nr:adenylate/guanylate cyclase domain-containing protein [Calditrichota bacterium]